MVRKDVNQKKNESPWLRVGEEFVLVNDSRHRQLGGYTAAFHSHHAALAAHPDAFRQGDLGRKGQREINRRAGLDRGIDVEADPTSANVAGLRWVLLLIFPVADRYRQTKSKPARGSLVVALILRRLSH